MLSLGAAGAQAATVTVGPALNGLPKGVTYTCGFEGGCTFSQAAPQYTAPISGTIVRWRVIDSHGPLTLRVLDDNTGGPVGPTVTAATDGLQEFPADVPIKAGEQIGVDLPKEGSNIAFGVASGTSIEYWAKSLVDGENRAPTAPTNGFQLFLNADIQPPPGITGLSTPGGPINMPTGVVITGNDLTGATAVSFGGVAAAGFTVDSESQITATAPPSAKIAKVPVSVTTVAGTATSTQRFSYEGCAVPKLSGLRLKAVKKKIKATGCRLGKVSKRKGATPKKGRVAKQSPKPGKVLAPGTKIKLTLKP